MSYHYGCCPTKREEAFRYSIEAGSECITRGAHCDALVFVQRANSFVTTVNEGSLLMTVIDCAIDSAKPSLMSGIIRKFGKMGKTPSVPSITSSDVDEILNIYATLKENLTARMVELQIDEELSLTQVQDGHYIVKQKGFCCCSR